VQSGILVGADTRLTQNISMVVGDTRESVTITADAPALETATASSGQVFTTHEVVNCL